MQDFVIYAVVALTVGYLAVMIRRQFGCHDDTVAKSAACAHCSGASPRRRHRVGQSSQPLNPHGDRVARREEDGRVAM